MSISNKKVLVIGTDAAIFDPQSSAGVRIREYSRLFGEYHMIIYTGRGFLQNAEPPLFLYPTNSQFYFLRPFDAFRIGRKIIHERGITLVSTQDPAETGIAGWLLKRMCGVKLQIQVHADFFSHFFRENSWKEFVRYLAAKFILPRGDTFRVVSKRIADSLHSTFHIPHSQISVLPIFVDRARIAATKPSFDLRQKYPQFDFIVLMVSRLAREKNISMALEAFAELVKEFPKNGLVIVGDGPELKNLELGTRNLELRDSVRFEGWKDDLISYYKEVDLYLLTSNFEGYGRTVIEAAAAGCPVVMTDVGVAGEIVKDGETGRVISVADKSALVSALRDSRYHYGEMQRMAKKAQEFVLSLPPRTWKEYLYAYKATFQ